MSDATPRQRSIPRQLFNLSAPIIGLNVLNVLTIAVDTAMCGRLPDFEVALTGLGYATQIVFLLMVGMMGLTVGSVALVARAHGAKKPERVAHLVTQSTILTVLLGLAVALIGNLVAPGILALLGAEPASIEAGLSYLRPLLAGTVLYYLILLYGALLRGVGNTIVPFLVAVVTNAVNFLVNYALILGNWGFPQMGLAGAAIGTLVAQAIGAVALILVVRRGVVPGLSLRAPTRPFIDRELARELVKVGAPAAADMIIINAAFLSIVGMLGRLDELAVAAHGIGLRVQAIAFVPGMSVSQATAALVGQALGAGSVDRARAVLRASLVLCVIVMMLLAVPIVIWAAPIVTVFDVPSGSKLQQHAVLWMQLLGFGMPIAGLHIAFVGLLQGAGRTRTSLRINIVGTLLFQIPLSWALGFPLGLGIFGVWLAFPLSFAIKLALSARAYRRGQWAVAGSTLG